MYDPALGRFLSADPFVQAPFFSQSLNRYSYACNNPLSFVDPTGYQATDEYQYYHPGLTYDSCVPGAGCTPIDVGPVNLPGVYNDVASDEPFGHRESGPPGLGLAFSLDMSDLRPSDALGSRWNPHTSLGQAGRDVFGEERPVAAWSLSPEMTRAVMGLIPFPGMSSLTAFSDPRATPTDKAIAVALDALSVVGVGAVIKFAGKAAGAAGKAGSAARAGVEALEQSVGAARGAPEFGGFARGISTGEIEALNRGLGGTTSIAEHSSSAFAAAVRQQGFFNKSAAMITEIAGRHMFDDANKRTAQAVYETLAARNGIASGASSGRARSIIGQVARVNSRPSRRSRLDCEASNGHR
ncbi:RHS repeat-associated core domain-containing protein [Sorangium sp. So ce542]|uniref:RHS repeat-associated core domain-containing protein n=1 Tax=Sorangium sp. So ce542 TaxID=3133316 RepID=UPI003F5EE4EB